MTLVVATLGVAEAVAALAIEVAATRAQGQSEPLMRSRGAPRMRR